MSELRIGDRVRLNSGGPECLVVHVISTRYVIVAWPDDQGVIQEYTLPAVCLEKTT